MCVLLSLAMSAFSAAEAKRIYSYRDEQGVVHFSDRPPTDARGEVSEQLVEVDPRQLIHLREDGPQDDRRYTLWNGYGGPVEVLLAFQNQSNIVSEPALPASVVIPAQQHTQVLQVQPFDRRQSWRYQWTYRYLPGSPQARHDDSAEYLLPFPDGLRVRVDQGFGGSYSHSEAHSRHAVDLSLELGTPVRAARGGVVMAVESDFHGAGTDLSKYGDRANHIRLLHPDGTMAVYAHLELESVLVAIGDRVRAGEVIAKSGNTGFSSGPHLHFVIQRNRGGELVSVPFQFTVHGEKIRPETGVILGGP
ncbi:MAG: M23 family metallopeptidase [Xanthomonadales bacterium]|nr:M23 family metallopeptidase [Xanthomonadales bacterium]MCE7930811.1 DUF4124 domain-containing protein [Xanthomonadales bacterium PRO6]